VEWPRPVASMAATWRVRYSCPEPGDSLCIPIATSCSSHLPEARHTGPRGHPAGYGDPQTWGTGPWSHRRWSWTPRVCARSRRRYRPGRPVRSAEHAHVVPDVPPTPRRAVRGAYGWRETPCQRHVSPHNPSRFETTTDIPPPAAISPHAAGPNPMYQPLSHGEGVGRCDLAAGAAGVDVRADMRPTRRSTTPLPRRPSGRAAITLTSPPADSKSLAAFASC